MIRLSVFFLVTCTAAFVHTAPAAAQGADRSVEVGGHVSVLRLSGFDTTDAGVGLHATWSIVRGLAGDAAVTWFPAGDEFDAASFSAQSRMLGLAGLRMGKDLGRVTLYGRGRLGFLRFAEQENVICIAIFPIPLSCRLATGHTAFAGDLGGGASLGLDSRDRLQLRLEASDLIVRYDVDAQVRRPNGEMSDGFVSHNLLLQVSLGWRF
jgi:hypothetical protein